MYRLLIIDDEPWSRQVVKSLGEWDRLGLSIAGEAEDGTQGLRMIGELEPHIIVTDMRMPGIDGVELLKTVCEQHPALKIIVMSGYDDIAYLKQAIRSHAVEYLLKPIDPPELNAALARCIGEIEQERAASGLAWMTPRALSVPAVMGKYLAFRQQINGYLLDANRTAVVRCFELLGGFLQELPANAMEEADAIKAKVCHDCLELLEKHINENEPGLDRSLIGIKWEDILKPGRNTIAGAVNEISQLYAVFMDAMEASQRNRSRLDMVEVQAYIDRHYQEQLTLETMAQRFFVSKEHLSRAFRARTGETVSDYITRRKMDKARELIVDQKLSIKRAAEITGYDDLAYFYRVFKKHYGVTPGELRLDVSVHQ